MLTILPYVCVCYQAVLSSRPEGDSKLQDLRRQGQSLCEHQDLEESRRREVQQTVRDMEEEWRRVLQAAKEALDRAEVLEKELRAFETWKEGTWVWVKDQKQQLHSQSSQTKTEERLHTAQAVLSSRSEGDSKLQDLRRQGQSLCEHQDLEENSRREVQQTVRDMEEEWRRVLQTAEEILTKAEMQSAIEGQLRDLETQKENSRAWIKGQHQHLLSLGSQAKTENRMQTAQAVLSSRPEGDSKLQDLRRRGQSLCEHQDLEESRRREVQQTVRDMEEEWGEVLKAAKEVVDKAEVQSVIEREMIEYVTQKGSIQAWVRDHKQRLHSLGSQSQTDDRINVAQVSL
ncbi:unnamed protein product [Oncorhynchus mykiss]|uniref:Uncharacterized protein n=1 Tax=Oncorhynchus mykiss TaxID=8022 RepID=A0A060VUW7_ONCMY|nr:unnamed protein product [Oncorhynchus mykiss]